MSLSSHTRSNPRPAFDYGSCCWWVKGRMQVHIVAPSTLVLGFLLVREQKQRAQRLSFSFCVRFLCMFSSPGNACTRGVCACCPVEHQLPQDSPSTTVKLIRQRPRFPIRVYVERSVIPHRPPSICHFFFNYWRLLRCDVFPPPSPPSPPPPLLVFGLLVLRLWG